MKPYEVLYERYTVSWDDASGNSTTVDNVSRCTAIDVSSKAIENGYYNVLVKRTKWLQYIGVCN